MTDMEMRRYNMLIRVRDFGQARRQLFPEGSVKICRVSVCSLSPIFELTIDRM